MDDSSSDPPTGGVGSFFANARKKMSVVAQNLDAQATRLLGSRKPPRCRIPADVYNAFLRKLKHPANNLILEAMRVCETGY